VWQHEQITQLGHAPIIALHGRRGPRSSVPDRGSAVASVELDGVAVDYTTREANRGVEVWTTADPAGHHALVVMAGSYLATVLDSGRIATPDQDGRPGSVLARARRLSLPRNVIAAPAERTIALMHVALTAPRLFTAPLETRPRAIDPRSRRSSNASVVAAWTGWLFRLENMSVGIGGADPDDQGW
jgi:hypothetical protein